MPQIATAHEIQDAINASLAAAGLGPSYRMGLPAKLAPVAPNGPNWHFLDTLTGDIEAMTIATDILAKARRKYTLAD